MFPEEILLHPHFVNKSFWLCTQRLLTNSYTGGTFTFLLSCEEDYEKLSNSGVVLYKDISECRADRMFGRTQWVQLGS